MLNLVNNDVSRETILFCNAPLSGDCLLPALLPWIKTCCLRFIWLIRVFHVKHFCLALLHHREIVCCLPSFSGHLLVGLPHFGLRPVQLDRLRICPLQCRQRQQNISLSCAYKAGLSFAKIPNWDGQQRRLFYPSWTQSVARKTIKLMSSCPTLFWSGKRRDRQR